MEKEFSEQLANRANPLLVELTDRSNHFILKSEDGEITIISKDFLSIKTMSNNTEDVVKYLDEVGGRIIDFTILSPEKIKLSYELI